MRDLDGILHTVPNGEIKVASNYTRAWSRAHLDIRVAYKESVDDVMSINLTSEGNSGHQTFHAASNPA